MLISFAKIHGNLHAFKLGKLKSAKNQAKRGNFFHIVYLGFG